MVVDNACVQWELKQARASPVDAAVTVKCVFFGTAAECACLAYLHARIEKNGNVSSIGRL